MDNFLSLQEISDLTSVPSGKILQMEMHGKFPHRKENKYHVKGWTEVDVLNWMVTNMRKGYYGTL